MNSPKYNRTLHVPWSKGATNDDKIAKSVESLVNVEIVITEKVDGSNTSLEKDGCFARTHSGPPDHPSFDGLKALHANLKYLIPDSLQLFGEWCWAVHSIPYDKLPGYFLLFNTRDIRDNGKTWESWDMVQAWANELQVPTVPVLYKGIVTSSQELQELTEYHCNEPSRLGSTREGVVIRVRREFSDKDFSKSVMKWVRANHVQTTEHWKNQEIVKNKLCGHMYQDQCDGGFTCIYCKMLNPN